MSEKQYKYLRKKLGYKPSYKDRRYKLIPRIIEFLRRGKWQSVKRDQRINVGARRIYRQYKNKLDRFDPYSPDRTK